VSLNVSVPRGVADALPHIEAADEADDVAVGATEAVAATEGIGSTLGATEAWGDIDSNPTVGVLKPDVEGAKDSVGSSDADANGDGDVLTVGVSGLEGSGDALARADGELDALLESVGVSLMTAESDGPAEGVGVGFAEADSDDPLVSVAVVRADGESDTPAVDVGDPRADDEGDAEMDAERLAESERLCVCVVAGVALVLGVDHLPAVLVGDVECVHDLVEIGADLRRPHREPFLVDRPRDRVEQARRIVGKHLQDRGVC
jgi:hypothetical protein